MQMARRLLAGLDVGVVGGLLVLLWFSFHSWLLGEFWWTKFNVAGGFFFGSQVFSLGFGWATAAGAALLIVLYALAGMLLAVIFPFDAPAPLRWIAVFCLVIGLHLLFDRLVYPKLTPFALSYFRLATTAPAHFLYGLNFLRLRRRWNAIGIAPY